MAAISELMTEPRVLQLILLGLSVCLATIARKS